MAEGAGLLNRCSVLGRYRGFESLSLRKKKLFREPHGIVFLFLIVTTHTA